jgi:hypothetical protein
VYVGVCVCIGGKGINKKAGRGRKRSHTPTKNEPLALFEKLKHKQTKHTITYINQSTQPYAQHRYIHT